MANLTVSAAKPVKEMVYDMDTGEMKEKKPDLGGIAEGDEEKEDDWKSRFELKGQSNRRSDLL